MSEATNQPGLSRKQIAWRVAQDIEEGAFVNLGIGQPEQVANYLPEGKEIIFHSENGILGMGETPLAGEEDYDLINAGKKPITLIPGGSFCHHADSFSMIRGGHIDICVLGAYQVSATGDLANWSTGAPGAIPGVGGAMDLAVGAKRTCVMTSHCTKDGKPKLVDTCSYPLTAVGAVNRIYTELAVIDVTADGFLVQEMAPGLEFDELQKRTGAPLTLSDDCRAMDAPDLG